MNASVKISASKPEVIRIAKTNQTRALEGADLQAKARAKARVTPTKTESVSRLELAACVIGTRLGLTVANAMDIDKSTITFWTDSTNCLH